MSEKDGDDEDGTRFVTLESPIRKQGSNLQIGSL